MRISHRHRFIFFSFPKTGSESVREALDPLSDISGTQWPVAEHPFLAHLRPIEVRVLFQQLGWRFEDYYRFVFIRNPWVRLASLYRMIKRTEEIARGNRFTTSFSEWVLTAQTDGFGAWDKNIGSLHRLYGTYTLDNFVNDENGNRLVDEVFRLEDMKTVPQRLRDRGIPFDGDTMPWVNQTDKRHDLGEYYTPALRAVVAMRYAKEIEEFGYVFPG